MAKLAPCSSLRGQRGEQRAPVLRLTHLERLQRKAVARHMLLRDRIPTAVFDRHTGFIANRLEPHIDVRRLLGRKRALPPAEREPFAGNPHADAADLKRPPVRQIGHEAPALTRLKPQLSVAAGRQLKEPVRLPPQRDLLRENCKCLPRRGLHPERHNNSGRHGPPAPSPA